MLSLSKIKNINILVILLLLPTTNYSFIPGTIIPKATGLFFSGTTIATLIAQMGLEGIRNSPKLTLVLSTLSLGTGFGAYMILNQFTPESALKTVALITQEHTKLMNNKTWKNLTKIQKDSNKEKLNSILHAKHPGAYSDVHFSEKDLKPQLAKLKSAEKLVSNTIDYMDTQSRYPLIQELKHYNKNTMIQLNTQKKLIKECLTALNEIAEQIHLSPNFEQNHYNFFLSQKNQAHAILAKEKIQEAHNKNSCFNRLWEMLTSNPIFLNNILQIIISLVSPITN